MFPTTQADYKFKTKFYVYLFIIFTFIKPALHLPDLIDRF